MSEYTPSPRLKSTEPVLAAPRRKLAKSYPPTRLGPAVNRFWKVKVPAVLFRSVVASFIVRKSPPIFTVCRPISFDNAALSVIGLSHLIGAVFRFCPALEKFWNDADGNK